MFGQIAGYRANMQNFTVRVYISNEVKKKYKNIIYHRVKKVQTPRNKSQKIYAKPLRRRL